MRRTRTSPNVITVNIGYPTPTKSTPTIIRTPAKTPVKTPVKTSIKTPIRTSIRTPVKTPIRSNQQNNQNTPNIEDGQLSNRKRTNGRHLSKTVSNSRQSLNSLTSYSTPSPTTSYNLRNKSSVFAPMCTMSDSKLERKPLLKRSHQEETNTKEQSSQRNENSVCVAIRVRPLNCRELNPENANLPVLVNSETNTIKVKDKNSNSYLEFSFDHCFNSTKPSSLDYASQEKIYLSIGRPLFEKIFSGNNVCVFTYGQTGSGKSHTIMGTNDNNGLIPRFAREFFIHTKSHEKKLVIEASYYEIYNEKIHDLLADIKNLDEKKPLKMRVKPIGGPYVENLSVQTINSVEDLFNILIKGNKNRSTASTLVNDRSSRSHVIFNLNVYEQKSSTNEENSAKKKICTQLLSKINFIDLAGSERASVLGSTGDRLKEGNLINKSLLTLGKVINLLSDSGSSSSLSLATNQHIPYRESILTFLLKDCLGGNSYTCMIATISPSVENLEESLSTLRYASKARRIVNKINPNKPNRLDNLEELEQQMELEFDAKLIKIDELIRSDLEDLKKIVLDFRTDNYCLVDKVKELFPQFL